MNTTFELGGTQRIDRLGFGAMRITGPGIWGPPADHDAAIALLRRAVELGVSFIDTAAAYGPYVSEELIREALHPYAGVHVATKGGLLCPVPSTVRLPSMCGHPDYLRQEIEMSLRRLGVDTIDLWQLHRIDPAYPAADQFGVLTEAVDSGRVRHVGLSSVTVEEIEQARRIVPVATVQNLFNLASRSGEDVLEFCEANGIGFIPFFPLAAGALAEPGGPAAEIASRHGASAGQIALAWLLHRSPVIIPIPGTGSIDHLEQNMAAASIELSDAEMTSLNLAVPVDA